MTTTTEIRIRGLKEVTATGHLEHRIEAVPHVQSVEIDPQNERAIVEHDGADLTKITTAIAEEGFEATLP